MEDKDIEGLCPLCAVAHSRTSCTLTGCKNSFPKPRPSRDIVAVGGNDEARQQMESLNRLVKEGGPK